MDRDMMQKLKEWKTSKRRKPLVLEGARQVGKTWLMREFGRREFQQTAYLNLSEMPEAGEIFEGGFDPATIMRAISHLSAADVVPRETLIILDEIQESERALNALKFFRERLPEYHVMAAGSLLGVAMRHEHMSYPVGNVETVQLHPLSFYEFMGAMGREGDVQVLQEGDERMVNLLHDGLCSLLEEYMMVGGMPEVVQAYADQRSGQTVRDLQLQILNAYSKDFAKYTSAPQVVRISEVWRSIPSQLAHQNGKFSYGKVKPGARGRDYESAITWLELCGLVRRVCRVSKPEYPLPHYAQSDAFKLFLCDTGLMNAMVDPELADSFPARSRYAEFKGAITEQCVCQMFTASMPNTPIAYWMNPTGSAEVDFLLQHAGCIIPIEVKAATNTQSKSLRVYCEKYAPQLAIRASLARYGKREKLLSLPLYMVESLPQCLQRLAAK